MLKINVKERISWNDCFHYSFFKNISNNNLDKISYPQFNFQYNF